MLKYRCKIIFKEQEIECSLMLMSLFRVLYDAKGEIVHPDQIACAAFGEKKTYEDGVDDNQIRTAVDRLRYKIRAVSESKHIFSCENGYRMDINGTGEEVLQRISRR